MIVGRDASCDFTVAGTGVSRRHFSVAPVQGGYLLRDESANGTVINGSRVSGTYLLGHGDVMLLHEEELRFELVGVAPPAPTEAAAPTAILDMTRIRRELKEGDKKEAPAPAISAILEIVRGQFAGASFPIERPACSIGRGAGRRGIRDDSISTNHATLLRRLGGFVGDLRSANGTFAVMDSAPGRARADTGLASEASRGRRDGIPLAQLWRRAPRSRSGAVRLTALLLSSFRNREAFAWHARARDHRRLKASPIDLRQRLFP